MNTLLYGKLISSIKKNKWTIFENDFTVISSGSEIQELSNNFKYNNCLNILIQDTQNNTPKILQNPNNKIFSDLNQSNIQAPTSYIICYYEGSGCSVIEKQRFQDSFFYLIKILSRKIKIKNVFNFCLVYKQDNLFTQHLKEYSFVSIYNQVNGVDAGNVVSKTCKIKSLNEIIGKLGEGESMFFKLPKSYEQIEYSIIGNVNEFKQLLVLKESSLIIFKKNQRELLYIIWLGDHRISIQKVRINLLSKYLYISLNELNTNNGCRFNIEIIKLSTISQLNDIDLIVSSNSYHDGYNNLSSSPGLSLNSVSASGSAKKLMDNKSFSVPAISPSLSVKSSIENSPSFFIKKRVSPHSFSPNNSYLNILKNLSSTPKLKFPLPLSPTSNTVEIVNNNQGEEIFNINQVSYYQPQTIFEAFESFNQKKINWLIIGYQGNNLKLFGSGANGLPEFKQSLSSNNVLYGVLGINFKQSDNKTNIYKSIFVEWLGKNSSTKEKVFFTNNVPAISLLFKQKAMIHCDLRCDLLDDLCENTIFQKITSFRQEIQLKQIINSVVQSSTTPSTKQQIETIN